MIKSIEINQEDMEKILDALPLHIQNKIKDQIESQKPDSGIRIIKQFVEQYEDDQMVDHMLACAASGIIVRTITSLSILQKNKKTLKLSPHELSCIIIDCMKKLANILEEAVKEQEKDRKTKH